MPSDVCKIYKKGSCLRMDTTLVDFNEKTWERGDITFIFDSTAKPGESLVIMDNKAKVYQKVKYEETEQEIEDEVDALMSSDVVTAQLSTKHISFVKATTGWIFKQDRIESVGSFKAEFYHLDGMMLISRKRREHLTSEDVENNKAVLRSLQSGAVENADLKTSRRKSLAPPPRPAITFKEYLEADLGHPPCLGRQQVVKRSIKQFKATIAMSKEFPLTIAQLLDILEIIAPFKHLKKLRDFCEVKLPQGFPVKIEIPLFPTISAKITFQNFNFVSDLDDAKFKVPKSYREDNTRFPDL